MIKIKKNRRDYDKIVFTSDTHFGHDRDFLYTPRGFPSVKEHNEWIENQIHSLTPNSLLIHLGDVGLTVGSNAIQDFLLTFPCETLMVFGNHNSGVYQMYQQHLPRGFERCQIYPLKITPNITILGYEFLLDIDQYKFHCRHMASLIWPEMNKNRYGLCGHSHGNLISANPNENGLGKLLDVGIENAIKYNNSAFFSLTDVLDIMSKKEVSQIDHHQ